MPKIKLTGMKLKAKLLFICLCISSLAHSQSSSGSVGTIASRKQIADSYPVQSSQKLEFSSVVHVRYQLFDDTTKTDGFDLRRVRLSFKGDVAPRVGYRFQAEMANTPKILDAVFIYKPDELLNVNIGQSKTPYCYDNYYSPFTLLTVSRPQLDNALGNRENDLYGNNQGRDIGLWLTGKYSMGSEDAKRPVLEYILGIYNGAGMNVTDNNNFKDFGAALRLSPIKDLWISGRAYHGSGAKLIEDPDSTADRIRLGGDLTYKYKSFIVEGEYLTAEDHGAGKEISLMRSAFYVTLGYTIIKDKLQVVGRLDNYDKNIKTNQNAINKYIIAGSWYFNKTTRVQMEYNFVAEEDPNNQINNNVFAIQFQAGF